MISTTMPHVTLTKQEIAVLKNAIRRGDSDPGFQELLVTLDRLLDMSTSQLFLSEDTLALIRLYSVGSRNPSWHAILFAILGRTVADFGRRVERDSPLVKKNRADA